MQTSQHADGPGLTVSPPGHVPCTQQDERARDHAQLSHWKTSISSSILNTGCPACPSPGDSVDVWVRPTGKHLGSEAHCLFRDEDPI